MINRVTSLLAFPFLFFVLWIQSEIKRGLSLFHRSRIHLNTPYNGAPILMVALYEKGALRADIELLMKRARANGFYVIGVNTRSISSPAIIRWADLYIERFNFGRDFGSYKAGIAYITRHFDLER